LTADTGSTVTVGDGGTVEIDGTSAQSVTFTGTTGTLKIDHSLAFAGQISGLAGSDALDLADVSYGANTTATFSGNINGGTLTVTDGAHAAHISLLGDYLKSGWTLSSDGHGGTVVVDPPTILPGYPNATTTGVPAGVTLTPHNGDLVINTPGTVISGLNITGTVYVNAPNVTIEDCRIDAKGGYFCINASTSNSAGLTVSDCTLLNSAGGNVNGSNIECNGATILRNDMSGFSHCIASDGGNLIQDNYMHDLNGTTAGHYECIYIGGGAAGDTINHNTMISFDTADVFMKTDYGPVNNEIVENNLMLQQSPVPVSGLHTTSYNIYLYNTGDGVSGNVVTNNIMQQGYYGYTDVNDPGVVWQGNTDYSTGQTISVNGTLSPAPATGPNAPVIKSFSPDSGVIGDGITNTNKLDLKGTADPNSTITVYDGSTKLGTTTASSTGSWDYITSVLTNAKHVLTATETNTSGQTSAASAALTVTVDTHVPAAPVLVSDSVVNTNHVQLSGTAEANSTITVYDGGTVVGTGTTGSTGAWSVTTGALPSGTQALTATATDVAGTVSAMSQPLDPVIPAAPPPTPPAAPQITSFSTDSGVVGDHITNDNTPTLTGTAVANSTVKVFDATTQVGTATADSSGQWHLTTSALSDGPHNLTATETNTSGQTSAASAALTVTVDTHVPAAPVLVSDSVVNTNHVQLSGTAEANSTITVYDGGTVVGTGTTGSTGAWSVTTGALPSGTQALTATATDVAGTVSAMSQPLDPVIPAAPPPTPPAAPQITSFSTDSGVVGDHITNDNTPTLTGTAVANSTVKVFDATTQVGTATADSSGQWHLTTSALSDGPHNLTATETNTSGQTSAASAAFSVTVDTHAPAAPTMAIYSQAGAAVGNTTTLTDLVLKGSAEANSTIDIFDGGKQIGTAATSSAGAWSFDTGSLANGSHSLTAKAIDVAGTIGTASAADVVSITAPSTPALNPIEYTDVTYSNHTATIKGTADAYSQIKLYDGTLLLGTATASANGTWSVTKSHLHNTLHTITAQELDSSGHVVETSSGAVILAASNTSMFKGTGGDDFMYSNSSNLNDTFVFVSNFGHSTIQGFTAAGSGHDTVQFSKSVFDSFASVLSHASQVGQDVVISSGSDTLKLLNTKLSALNSQDFHFA
jgi:hypothetical protein